MRVSVLGWNKYLAHHTVTEARAAGSLCKVVNLGPRTANYDADNILRDFYPKSERCKTTEKFADWEICSIQTAKSLVV